jgi:hypothetical protein
MEEIIIELDELEKARLEGLEKEKRLTDVEDNVDTVITILAAIEGVTL